MLLFVSTYYFNEGMSSITFVKRSLYPKGYNASKDEGTLTFNILCCLVLKPKHLRTSLQQHRLSAAFYFVNSYLLLKNSDLCNNSALNLRFPVLLYFLL
jgi:hypothetical protein